MSLNSRSGYYIRQEQPGCGIVVGCIIIAIAMLLLFPFALMVAWNASMPFIFGLPSIDYPQAFALYVVFSIILGIIRGGGTSKE